MRRGRPRHDDVLTPREWQVLDLLREDLTNEQIAARLGISHDTAKFHVSEILTKLGVQSRQEAAAWPGRPKVAFGLAPFASVLQKLASIGPLKIAGGGAIGAASVGLAALALGVMLDRGAEELPSEPVVMVPVQWIEEELPDPVSWEAPRPFQDVVPSGEQDVWRAYLLEHGGADPRLVAETNRNLLPQVTWGDGELVFSFLSRKQSSSGELGLPIYGFVAYEPGNAEPVWDRITDEYHAALSPEGNRIVFSPDYGELHYFDRSSGASMAVEGFVAEQNVARFAPAGDYFYVAGYEENDTSVPPKRYYLYVMRPGDTEAIRLDTSAADGTSFYFARWSPDGSRLAYPALTGIMVVDLESQTARRLPVSGGNAIAGLDWSEDGHHIIYQGAIINADDGRVLHPFGSGAAFASLSPDARYAVVTSNVNGDPAFGFDGCPEREPGFHSNRTMIYDLQSKGPGTPALACMDVPYMTGDWIDERHILMVGFTCPGCSPALTYRHAVLDVGDGSVTHLEDAPASGTYSAVAGGRIALAGSTLRLFDTDGSLLREIAVPNAEKVQGLSLSPDGSRLVFMTGPAVDVESLWRP